MTGIGTPAQINPGDLLSSLWGLVVDFVPVLVSAVVVGAVGYLLAGFVDNRLYRFAMRNRFDTKARETPLRYLLDDSEDAVAGLLGTVGRVVVYLLTLAVVVGVLNVAELNQLVGATVNYTGNFLGAVVLLVLGAALGRIVRNVVRRVVANTSFPGVFERTLIADVFELSASAIAGLTGRVAGYYVYLLTAYTVAGVLAIGPLESVLGRATGLYPGIAAGALLVFLGAAIATGVGEAVTTSDALAGLPGRAVAGKLVEAAVYLFTAVIALSVAGVADQLLRVLVLATVLPLALGVALAFGLAFGYGGKDRASEYLESE